MEAASTLTYADWIALSNAACHDMHESTAAFNVFTRLYWRVRGKKTKGPPPSRNVAWLTLKLMASVPKCSRAVFPNAVFNPLQALAKRQIGGFYPISFPRGPNLEEALRAKLINNICTRYPKPVDWIGLCQTLDQMLD